MAMPGGLKKLSFLVHAKDDENKTCHGRRSRGGMRFRMAKEVHNVEAHHFCGVHYEPVRMKRN